MTVIDQLQIANYQFTKNCIACLQFTFTLFWGAPKLLQMVTAAMKLKDAHSLEGKL